ncbi:MAG: hypothetical protein KFF68_17415 [Desulfosarcina sp.]|nr:hypothetical protein [Desulfosarcina sp.]
MGTVVINIENEMLATYVDFTRFRQIRRDPKGERVDKFFNLLGWATLIVVGIMVVPALAQGPPLEYGVRTAPWIGEWAVFPWWMEARRWFAADEG